MDFTIITTIVGIFAGIGLLIAGIGYGYAQFRTGANKAKDELVETLEKQLEIEREKTKQWEAEKQTLVASHQTQLNKLTQDVGKLQGLNEANEKKIKEYQDILQGRDPAQQKFMEIVLKAIEANQSFMEKTTDILSEIKIFMGDLNKLHTDRHPEVATA